MSRSLEKILNSDLRLCERDEPEWKPLFAMKKLFPDFSCYRRATGATPVYFLCHGMRAILQSYEIPPNSVLTESSCPPGFGLNPEPVPPTPQPTATVSLPLLNDDLLL